MRSELCELAPLFGVGALEGTEQREFERHLDGCEACASEVQGYQEAAAALALLTIVEPPAGLRGRLLDRLSVGRPAALVRRDEGEWSVTPFEGLTVKQLFTDPATGNVTSMIRMQPGAIYPGHWHAELEHCYVLEGDLVFADHTLLAGDYEVAAAETTHSPVTTRGGCLLLIINNTRDRLLPSGPASG